MNTHNKKFEELTIERSARTWIIQIKDRPSDIVAVVIKNGHYAKLIQAAPDLLEACKSIVKLWEGGDLATAARQCSEVIAKVEGQSL
jgi:hypothetical protein